MSQRIELTSTTVSVWEDDELVWSADANQAAQGLFGQKHTPRGLILPAVRWIGPGSRLWVFERPPGYHKVLLAEHPDSVFKVIFPWQVYAVDMKTGDFWVFARPSPIGSLEDMLFQMPLPGINDQGRVPIPGLPMGFSTDEMVQMAINQLTGMTWMGSIKEERMPPEIQADTPADMFANWSKEKDKLTVVGWGWKPRLTVQEFIDAVSSGMQPTNLKQLFEEAVRSR